MRSALQTVTWSRAALALVILAFTIAQAALVPTVLTSERDSTQILRMTGAQRARVQQIAYFVAIGHDGGSRRAWKAELLRTIDDMRRVGRAIGSRPELHVGRVDASGRTPLVREADAYFAAARAFALDPRDARAYAFVMDHRATLTSAYDYVISVRAQRTLDWNRRVLLTMLCAFVAFVLAFAIVWRRFVLPAERRAARATTKLAEGRRQYAWMFRNNPFAIGIYDRSGAIVNGNAASVALLGYGSDSIGKHFTSHVAPGSHADANAAFARALAGETLAFELEFSDARGEPIAICGHLFPDVVDGAIVGVIGISQDIRELKEAQAKNRELVVRSHEVYSIAVSDGDSPQQQVERALELVATRLGFDCAYVLESSRGGAVDVLGSFCACAIAVAPDSATWRAAAARIGETNGVWQGDGAAADGASRLAGVAMRGAGDASRVLVLAAFAPRARPLEDTDIEFLTLVATLLESGIEREAERKRLDSLAFFDVLTGLPNRAAFFDRATEFVARARGGAGGFALHFVDLDHFKAINDEFGHRVGDRVLQVAASRMAHVLRAGDVAARHGGDEFVILQDDCDDDAARAFAARVVAAFADAIVIDGHPHAVGASVGVASFPRDGADMPALLESADRALYAAKRGGRRRSGFATIVPALADAAPRDDDDRSAPPVRGSDYHITAN